MPQQQIINQNQGQNLLQTPDQAQVPVSVPSSVPYEPLKGILTPSGDFLNEDGNTISRLRPDGTVVMYGLLDLDNNNVYLGATKIPRINLPDDNTIILYEEEGKPPVTFKRA